VKILLLGASGQIGRLLAAALRGHDVRAPRRPEVDLRAPPSLGRAVRDADPEAVILAAGLANADFCEGHPSDAYAVNVDGARNAVEASRDRHFTFFSTDHVFDGRSGPYAEEDRPNPINTYGRTKLEAERIVLAVHPRALVVRTTIVFNHDPGGSNFLMKLLGVREPMRLWTDHRSTYTYGPAFAEAAAEMVAAGRTGLWHVAGPESLNRHEFALKVAWRFGIDASLFLPGSIRDAEPPAPRPLLAGLRSERAMAVLRARLPGVDEAIELAARAAGL
jgi:dTDP-4-dehydrorhamnose reductase